MENDHFGAAFEIIVAFLWAMTIKLSTGFLAWVPPLLLGHFILELLSKEISLQVKRADGNISEVSLSCMHFAQCPPVFPDGTGPSVPMTLRDCQIRAKDSWKMRETKESF